MPAGNVPPQAGAQHGGNESTLAGAGRQQSVDLANPLVGTASLDNLRLLGNAPPPRRGNLYRLHLPRPSSASPQILLGPLNKDLTEAAENDAIVFPYIYARRTMLGFSGPMPGLTVMPLVGDWTVPPDRVYASPYDMASEKAAAGYYSVFFPDSGICPELTTTEHVLEPMYEKRGDPRR